MLQALLFDFDGVILDTETPLFAAWEHTFHHYGAVPIGLDEWVASVGLHDDDPRMLDPIGRLRSMLSQLPDDAEIQAVRRRFRDDLLDSSPVRSGVEGLLAQCHELEIAAAIASSSPLDWIERHLRPRGLLSKFGSYSCAGGGVPGKPDPAVYLNAARALGVQPKECLAIEDSLHGVAAAKAAGMRCIAAPTQVTEHLHFDHADARVETLEEIVLADWL